MDDSTTAFVPYSEENKLLSDVYKNEYNYDIQYNENADISDLCYIYFSSNGLYDVKSEASFREKIIEQNRFEWKRLRPVSRPKKEIFLRDIWLSWYIKGINKDLDCIEKVLGWLRKETSGYRVVTVGNSSGGYMAAIAGAYLKAERVFCFCGQFSLKNHIDHLKTNPLLVKYGKDERYNRYFESYRLLGDEKLIYFYPSDVEHDLVQAEFVKNRKYTTAFKIKSDIHGVTVYSQNIPIILSWGWDDARNVFEKIEKGESVTQKEFSSLLIGKKATYMVIIKRKMYSAIFKIRACLKRH